MPESKLAEKLGFRVTENGDIVNLTTGFFIINEQSIGSLGSEKTCRIALWKLCLELSAELVGARIKMLREVAKLTCHCCQLDGDPVDMMGMDDEDARWEHKYLSDPPIDCAAQGIWNLIAAEKEKKA